MLLYCTSAVKLLYCTSACLTSIWMVRGSRLLLNQFFKVDEIFLSSIFWKNWFRRRFEPLTFKLLVKHAIILIYCKSRNIAETICYWGPNKQGTKQREVRIGRAQFILSPALYIPTTVTKRLMAKESRAKRQKSSEHKKNVNHFGRFLRLLLGGGDLVPPLLL